MRTKRLALSALFVALAAGCASQQPAPEPKAEAKPAPPAVQMGAGAAMLANTCAGCHGTDGVSAGPAAPTIAGMSEDYLVDALNAYRNGERYSTIMQRIMKGYTDAEIEAIAAHYANRPYMMAKQGYNVTLASEGAKLHEEYCEKCHEDGGRSVEDDAGLLAGQWRIYVENTLHDYVSGASEIAEKKMRTKLERMIEEQGAGSVEALAHFYASQK